MRKKVLVILVCMLMLASTMIIIRPENLEVKATSGCGGGSGDGVGINTTYIHSIAQELSNIIQYFQKGRAYGTSGEHYASVLIKDWMNEIGLTNVHYEYIKGTPNNPDLNKTEDIFSRGIYVGNQKLTDCYISPLLNYTSDSAHNFSYNNLDVRIPGPFPFLNRLFDSLPFINDLLARELNGSIHNFSTFFDFCMEKFEEKYNFTFDTFNASNPATYPSWCNGTLPNTTGWSPFLYIEVEPNYNPEFQLPPLLRRINPLDDISVFYKTFQVYLKMRYWNVTSCCLFKGLIKYNFDNHTYNMQYIEYRSKHRTPTQPILLINGSTGKPLYNSTPEDGPSPTKVSFWVNQRYNQTVNSSNVIGQINGTNPNKIVIIDCLYDSWWNQGAADSAIGMATVLSLAKYLQKLKTDYHIKPKYTMKFIAFSGEEAGYRGAQYYNDTHNENIQTIIDLNQLGFSNYGGPLPQTFFVNTNKLLLLSPLKIIVNDINYCQRTGTPYLQVGWSFNGGPSDCNPLVKGDRSRDSILFLKDMNWTLHHRNGENHTKGDTMDYYDPTDVTATADMIWSVTKYYVMNPNCSFNGTVTYTKKDSPNDEDTNFDTIEAHMPLQSVLPQDLVRIQGSLIQDGHLILAITKTQDYNITDTTSYYNFTITLPPNNNMGNYKLYLYLYNSTGRIHQILLPSSNNINDTTTSPSLQLYPRGNNPPTTPGQPNGPTTLYFGQRGTWGSATSDPNNDSVGQRWYMDYNNYPHLINYDTDLYDAESLTPIAPHRYITLGSHDIRVKAYDQYSTLLHPYVSDLSQKLTVTVVPHSRISSVQQLHQQGMMHAVQNTNLQLLGSQCGSQSVQWHWDLGDRSTASTQNVIHSYNSLGVYNVTLNVTDVATGLTGTSTAQVLVKHLDADFTMSYYHGAAPNTEITFHNISKGIYPITNCSWTIDDGTISYDSTVKHTFEDDGDYNVSLIVRDNENHTDSDYAILHITSSPLPPEIPTVQSPGVIYNSSDATIIAEVIPTDRNLSSVKIHITNPNNSSGNYTMTQLVDDLYTFTLSNSSQNGLYMFTVWATDSDNHINSVTGSYRMVLPFVAFESPTPADNFYGNQNWVMVNATVLDPLNTSAFIDWDHSLKGYWSMDLSNTRGMYDNSTFENFGMFEGGMNSTNVHTGKFGKALEFDGYDDDVNLGANSSLSLGTGDFTFMVWEKSDQTSYGNKAVLLTNRPSDASMKGYIFGLQNTPYLYVTQSPGNNITLSGKTDVTDHTWHHIAFIRRGTNHSIYVDGANDAGVTGSIKNITNNQHTYLSYGHMGNSAYFDGMLDEPQLYNRALSREEINASFNNGLYLLYHNFTGLTEGDYSYSAHAIDTLGNMSQTETRTVIIDFNPQITNVSASPHTVGFGYNVSITADVTDTGSGVDSVNVNITYPDETQGNYTMSYLSGDTYHYVFPDSWLTGQYNYTIWATDNSSNSNSSSGHHFHVSAQANMSIATLKNSYSGNQYINITDPPNPSENLTLVNRGLTWNTYYNASSGENILETYQGPVNYQEDNDSWTPINNTLNQLAENHPAYVYGYRSGNNLGLYGVYFKSNAQQDWPVAFTYNKSDDPTFHDIRSKLVGVGYVDPQSNWAYQYLQNVQSSQGQVNDYSITYPGVFTGTNVTWSYGNSGLKEEITLSNMTRTVIQNHPPSQYGLNDASSYLVFITKLDYQNLNLYNNSGLLEGNVTISDAGVDFRDILGQFKCALPLGEAYELNNETARQKLTYRIIHLNGNTYLLSGLKVSDLNAMTFPVVVDPTLTVYSVSNDGYIYNSGSVYSTVQSASSGTVDSSSIYVTIGQKRGVGPTYYVYRGFVLFNTSALPSNAYLDDATLSLYKKDDYSTMDFDITIQNGQPTYPHNPMQTGDYYRGYYSGNGGSLNTSRFTSGYNAIPLNNLSWINTTGITKLCLRSSRDINGNALTGNEYINVYSGNAFEPGGGITYKPKLVITYRNQSKIKDIGSTDIKGYLLIQVQFYNSSQAKWVLDNDTVNESTPRIITAGGSGSGCQLGLDNIFNELVRASDLIHGTGTYRVYVAFRDPEGNILRTNDDVDLEAWWQFSKT